MINEKTVFILGAGASYPYGYPTGAELKKDILLHSEENLSVYRELFKSKILADINLPKDRIDEFVKRFEYSRDLMIDYFLSTLESEKLISLGKIIIAASLVKYEKISGGLKPLQQKDDWYSILFTNMTEGITKYSDYHLFSENNISFITFNYDRSLEYLFSSSLKNKFNIGIKDTMKLLENIKIIHVFGRLPQLPHENINEKYQYGCNFNFSELSSIANNIKTINERTSIDCKEIHDEINSAKKIFILGFGYASENLEVLQLKQNIRDKKKVFCTAKNFSKYRIEKLRNTLIPNHFIRDNGISEHIEPPIIIDCDSSKLLEDYLLI